FGCFLVAYLFFTSQAYSQHSKLDSLQRVLDQKDLDLGEKVVTLSRLASHYYFDNRKHEGDSLLHEALQLAHSLPDKQYLARTLAMQAMQLRIQGAQIASQEAIEKSLKTLEETESLSVK